MNSSTAIQDAQEIARTCGPEAMFDATDRGRRVFIKGAVEPCSLGEYAAWVDRNPDPWLLRTPCLHGEVETVFDGSGAHPVFRTFWISPSARKEIRGGFEHEDLKSAHADAVRAAIRQFFSYPGVSFPSTSGASSLYGRTEKSSLIVGQPRDPLFVEPAELVGRPSGLRSLRFRLMRALGAGPSTWYALQDRLACEQNRALRTLELAWSDGLLVRTERPGRREPPMLELSPKGRMLFEQGRLSMADQGGGSLREDVHVPGWQAWSRHTCPLCGGGVQGTPTRKGNVKMRCHRDRDGFLSDAQCPGAWLGILKNGRLSCQGARIGSVVLWVKHWENRTYVERDGLPLTPIPEALSGEKLRDKLKLLVTFS